MNSKTYAVLGWVLLPLLMVLAAHAMAAPPPGVDPNSARAKLFEELMIPGTTNSCCGASDGHVVSRDAGEWRETAQGYEVRIAGQWVAVQPDRVLTVPNRIVTDADLAVAFYDPGYPFVYCFQPPPGMN